MTPVLDLEGRIRDLVNEPRKQAVLSRDRVAWPMLCSSLDVIGDAETAIEAYLRGNAEPREEVADFQYATGELYVTLYGILQVLFVQQDAVTNLAEALAFKYEPDSTLENVREIRNNAIGHPTKRGKGVAFNFISRITLSRTGCTLLTVRRDGSMGTEQIDVPQLIATQRQAIAKTLADILADLERDEMEHRRKFREAKLVGVFPQMLGYFHQKIGEAISGRMPESVGPGLLEDIGESITRLKGALRERDALDAYPAVTEECEKLEYPISELQEFLSAPAESKLTSADAAIFHEFIMSHLQSLLELARDIDRDYDQDLSH